MTGARARLAPFLPLVALPALALLAASCGGEPARGKPQGEASLAVITPSKGTIVFFDPKPRGTMNRGLRPRPVTITITTEGDHNRRADEASRTTAGTIPREGAEKKPTKSEVLRKFEALSASAYVTSPAKFKDLWEALSDVGVFKLPRYRGGIPPEDKASIRLTAEGRTWILMRPSDAPESLSADPEERAQVQGAWGRAKILIVEFVP